MNSASISVIIPAYNSAAYLPAALESVLLQTRPPDEIILVDDGSTDNTPQIAAGLADKITYLRQDNAGDGAARNSGVQHSSGSWLAFLDADDVWRADKLERQLRAAQSHPAAALIYSDCNTFGDKESPSWFADHPPHSGRVFKYLLVDDFMPMSSIVIRRDAFEAVGGFNESYKNATDFDLKLKISARYDVWGVREPLSSYRIRPDSLFHNRANSLKNFFAILEDAAQWSPDEYARSRRRVRQLQGLAACELGRLTVAEGDIVQTRNWLYRSLKLGGARPKALMYLASSVLPRRLWLGLRNLKRKLGGGCGNLHHA